MTVNKAAIDKLMAPLRMKYLAQLKEWLPTAAILRPRLEAGQCSQPDMSALKIKAHSLSGTGATYGFEAISEAGHALEIGLLGYNKHHTAEAVGLFDVLVNACEIALEGAPVDLHSDESSAAADSPQHRKPVLLTVDDDESVRNIFIDLLKDDAEVLAAANGREAVDIMRKFHPDFVILDDKMPGELQGLQLLEFMQNMPEIAHIPVMMLTASNKPVEIMRGKISGAVEYITKPFDAVTVVDKVRVRLQRLSSTILIADDDISIRELLIAKFRQAGLRVLGASDGAHALELARKHLPNLIILDNIMPKLSGMELIKELREIPALQSIPILLITANNTDEVKQQGLRMGATEYIVKPFVLEDVVERGARLLNVTL